MQHDLIQLTKITAHQLRGSAGYELMRCAVEAIAPDPVVLSKITRNRVRRRGRREPAEEGGVEDRTCGTSNSARAASMPETAPGLVAEQGGSGP